MSKNKSVLAIYLWVGLMIFNFAAQMASAQRTRNERDVRDAMRSLNSKLDDFRYSLDNDLGRINVSENEEREINDRVQDFEQSLNEFSNKLNRLRENSDDVKNILNAAQTVNEFLDARRFGTGTQRDWADIRTLLNRLAANYGVSWNWTNGGSRNDSTSDYPTARTNQADGNNLTGTYRLDASRSENTRNIADRAVRDGNLSSDPNAQSDLENKLQAPEKIVIEVRGNQVTLATSNAAQLTFTADGRDRTENASDGRTIRVRSTLRGQELTVSSLGGETDYTIIFASIENGRALKVTRRITTEYLRETIFADSVYEKTDRAAKFDSNPNYEDDNGVYSSNDPRDDPANSPTIRPGRSGAYVVSNGTILTGILEKDIDTKVSQNNDRFTLLVQSPNEYRGAVIEGYISGVNRSGKVSGRSQITFNFERIRLSNGRVYDFNGFLQSVTDENGRSVKVDTEGTAKGDNQTTETAKRGGIGAGIGAVIGAIAGGAKGAAIGAIIGAGGGAGTVLIQGKDDLRLKAGSTITVQASSPIR